MKKIIILLIAGFVLMIYITTLGQGITVQPQNDTICENAESVTFSLEFDFSELQNPPSIDEANWQSALDTMNSFSSIPTNFSPEINLTPYNSTTGSSTLNLKPDSIEWLQDYYFRCLLIDNSVIIDSSISVWAKIQFLPNPYAGNDTAICGNETVFKITKASIENYSSLFWSTMGDGTFSSDTLINPDYTLGENDYINGEVTLVLNAYSIAPCPIVSDGMVLDIIRPYVEIPDTTIITCARDSVYEINSNMISVEDYSYLNWNSTGDGLFSDSSIIETVYTYGEEDINSGSVELILKAFSFNCNDSISDTLKISIINPVVRILDALEGICKGETSYAVDPTNVDIEQCDDFYWTHNGDGSFSDPSLIDPVYTFGNQDFANGQVILTLNGIPEPPCQETVTTSMSVSLSTLKTPEIIGPAEICQYSANIRYSVDSAWPDISSFSWDCDSLSFTDNVMNEPTVLLNWVESLSSAIDSANIELIVEDQYGCKETNNKVISINAGTAPQISEGDTIIGKPFDDPQVLICQIPDQKYQWFKNEDILEGKTNQFLYPIEKNSGDTWYVRVINPDENTCYSNTPVFEYSPETYQKVQRKSYFSISPNPAKDEVQILLNTEMIDETDHLTIHIYDLTGVLMKEEKMDFYYKNIPVHELRAGVYAVVLYKKSSYLDTHKLLISK